MKYSMPWRYCQLWSMCPSTACFTSSEKRPAAEREFVYTQFGGRRIEATYLPKLGVCT
jgi:hypothetical protein